MNIRQYWKALNAFDWDYEYSEDAGLRKRKLEEMKHLKSFAANSDKHQSLFDGFLAVRHLNLKLTLPECPTILVWKTLRVSRKNIYAHVAEYVNEQNVRSIFTIKTLRGKRVLFLNGEEVKKVDSLMKGGDKLLRQTAEDML